MQGILDTIAEFFQGLLEDPTVQLGFQLIGIYIVLLWLATAFWAYRDMTHRTANPVLPYLAAAWIIVFTPVFFAFSAVLYRIVRPKETLAEANERALAEEAMLVEVEAQAHCASCHRRVERDWIICPSCRNRLRRVCPNCAKLVELDWTLCAWCGKDFERPELLREGPRSRVMARPLGGVSATLDPTTITPLGRVAAEAVEPAQAKPAPKPRTASGPR